MEVQQKIELLNQIGEIIITSTNLNGWTARLEPRVEIKNRRILKGTSSSGKSPEEAVGSLWNRLTQLEDHEVLVVDAYGPGRREIR